MLILCSKYLYPDIQTGIKLTVTGSKQFIRDLVKEFYSYLKSSRALFGMKLR